MAQYRSIARIVNSTPVSEGEGITVRRPFPSRELPKLDPFLLLDELGPLELKPGEAKGFPPHPHRGFETVSYVLEGALEHKDSRGHQGRLGPGSVQWMTAGSGVLHSEMPSDELRRQGGRMHMFQLWVNLPKADKMVPPNYQELSAGSLPVAWLPEGKGEVTIIAGEAFGKQAHIQTRVPILYLHFRLKAGARVEQPIPRDHNAFLYVIDGEIQPEDTTQPVGMGQLAILHNDGDAIALSAMQPAEFLLIAGAPLHEPVARYGPFVMNTQEEIIQSIEDFRSGQFGHLEE